MAGIAIRHALPIIKRSKNIICILAATLEGKSVDTFQSSWAQSTQKIKFISLLETIGKTFHVSLAYNKANIQIGKTRLDAWVTLFFLDQHSSQCFLRKARKSCFLLLLYNKK